jgi:hypothetical protein
MAPGFWLRGRGLSLAHANCLLMKVLTARAWLLPAALSMLAASAAAQVSGKLLLGTLEHSVSASPEPAGSYNWELENGFKEVRADRVDGRRELAVVLVSDGAGTAPDGKAGQDGPRVEVAFSGGGLLPSTIAVRTGTTLMIRNDDEIAHELYAPGLTGLSAEPTTPRGRRSISLKAPGGWPLRDRLVPHVAGYLHVLPDLVAVANVDASGQFSFSDVQPGRYTLKVFRGERELVSTPVELATRSLTLDPITLGAATDSK